MLKKYRVKRSKQQLKNGVPAIVHVFRQGTKTYYEGDIYDGNAPKEPLRKGWLEEVSHGQD